MPRLRVLAKPQTCCNCGEPFVADDDVQWLNEEEARHTRDCPAWTPAGPVSDGTLRCPRTYDGMPCQKRIPAGWHQNEGHAGGHWFEPDEHAAAYAAGLVHADAHAMLSLQPYEEHPASDCPEPERCPAAS